MGKSDGRTVGEFIPFGRIRPKIPKPYPEKRCCGNGCHNNVSGIQCYVRSINHGKVEHDRNRREDWQSTCREPREPA
jgi:hypothetical protein